MRIEGVIATLGMAAQNNTPVDGQVQRENSQTASVASQAQQAAQQGADAKPVGHQSLANAVHQVEQMVNNFNESLQFKIHKDTNSTIVSVVNKDSGEVIRQYPSEKFLDLVANFQKQLSGLLVDINQ